MNKSLIMTSCSKLKMLRSTPVLCRTLTNKIEDISTHTGQVPAGIAKTSRNVKMHHLLIFIIPVHFIANDLK